MRSIFAKGTIECWVFWLLSPLLSIFVFLINIYNKNKYAVLFSSLLFGALSFAYVPLESDDRTRHYESFLSLSHLDSFDSFYKYINDNDLPDFIVYKLMFVLSKFVNDPRFIFLCCSTITIFISFFIYVKVCSNVFEKSRLYFLAMYFMIVFSFSYPALFSGLRFYFASSFVLLAWYYLFWSKKFYIFLFCSFVAVFSHFSTALLIIGLVGLYLFPKFNYKKIFYISFLFTLLPGSFLFELLSLLPLGSVYLAKANAYLMYNDAMSEAANNGAIFKFLMYFKMAWVYLFLYFIVFVKTKGNYNSNFVSFVFIIISIRNIFASSPTILQYYDVLSFTLAVIYVIYFNTLNKSSFFLVIYVYVALNFGLELYKYRNSFIASNFRMENITSASMFGSDEPAYLKNQWE